MEMSVIQFVDSFSEKSIKVFSDEKLQKFSFAAFNKRCFSNFNAKTVGSNRMQFFGNACFSFALHSILCAQKAMKYKTESNLKFKCIGIDATEPDRNINIRLTVDIHACV